MASRNVKIGNPGLIKSMNKRIILDLILNNEMMSRSMLSEMSGLAMPTVMRIVDGFIEDGLVEEVGKGDSSGGRKPVMLRVNPNRYYFLGTDISRECHSVVANIYGEVLGKAQCAIDYEKDVTEITEHIRCNMRKAVENSKVDSERIVYSGVGTPGTDFKFMPASNLFFSFWSDTNRKEIENQLQIGYPTMLENVGRLGAAAELKLGKGKELRNFLYIYANEGVSMGAVINGRLETGYQGIGCEFGHTTINFSGQQCYCGSRGCVESYCSSQAMLREYKTQLLDHGLLTGANSRIHLFDFFCAIEGGDRLAEDVVKKAGTALGIGIGNLINLYNPEAIIMGGELCQTLPAYVQAAEEEARKHIFINDARDVKFYEATIQWDSEAVGALALASDKFFSEYCKR